MGFMEGFGSYVIRLAVTDSKEDFFLDKIIPVGDSDNLGESFFKINFTIKIIDIRKKIHAEHSVQRKVNDERRVILLFAANEIPSVIELLQ